MNSNKKKIISNLFVGFGGQLITICLGIVLPRLLLTSFGSEVNGLVSTVTQLYTYIAILEAGIGAASLNALYKCFAQKDNTGIADTLSATKIYFRRVSVVYGICVVAATVLLPFALETQIDKMTVALVVLLQGLSGLVNFSLVAAYEQLLLADGKAYVTSLINLMVTVLADGKAYVTSLINLMVTVLSYAARIVAISLGCSIVVVQTAFLLVSVTKAIVLYIYYRKNYPWIKYNKKADLSILKNRSAFMIHEISGVINHSSAVLIISIFCDLKQASVYTVYSLIYNNLRTLMNKISGSFDYYLGQTFHRSREEHQKLHDLIETYYIAFSFAIFTAAFCVTLPFIRLYTAGVNDADYLDVLLPYLFVIIELFSAVRSVASKLILISGNAKTTRINAIIQASITLTCSLIFVQFLGLHGVLLGSVASEIYRVNDMLIFSNRKILNRKPYKIYFVMMVCFLVFAMFAVVNHLLNITITSYIQFAGFGIITLVSTCVVYFMIISLVRLDLLKMLLGILYSRKR